MYFILIIVVCLLIGTLSGFFIGKYIMMKYLKENSSINEEMVKTMLISSGQKPSKKKINQLMKVTNDKTGR